VTDTSQEAFLFDADGYLRALETGAVSMTPETHAHGAMCAAADPTMADLKGLYYLQCRSAMRPIGTATEVDQDVITAWRQRSLMMAHALLAQHDRTGRPVTPAWFDDDLQGVLAELKQLYPTPDEVTMHPTLVPRVHARARRSGMIDISLMTREMLMHMNCALFALVDDDLSAWQEMADDSGEAASSYGHAQAFLFGRDPEVQEMARAFFPYWIMSHDVLHAHLMPFAGMPSREAFEFAHYLTAVQMRFILAHEYGHLYLNHFDRPARTVAEKTQIETEADQFAYRYLAETSKWDDGTQPGMLWIAARWLFRYQLGETLVGQILRGRSTLLDDLPVNTRRAALYECGADAMAGATHLIAERGHVILIALTAALREKGPDIVPELLDRFTASNGGPDQRQAFSEQMDLHTGLWRDGYQWWKTL